MCHLHHILLKGCVQHLVFIVDVFDVVTKQCVVGGVKQSILFIDVKRLFDLGIPSLLNRHIAFLLTPSWLVLECDLSLNLL
jgi:hypothetical protein